MCSRFSVYHTLCHFLCIIYCIRYTRTRYTYFCVFDSISVCVLFFVCLECYGLLFEIFFTLGVLGRCVNTNHFLTESKNTILSWKYCMYKIRSPPVISAYSQHTFFFTFGFYLLVISFGSACIYDTLKTPYLFSLIIIQIFHDFAHFVNGAFAFLIL